MFRAISFCVGNKTIEVNDTVFDLGVLSTEAMNLPVSEFKELWKLRKSAEKSLAHYLESKDPADWKSANEMYLQLDSMMMRYRIFRLIRQDDFILTDAKRYLEGGYDAEKEPTFFDLPGTEMEKWQVYKQYVDGYDVAQRDLASFHDTIANFIRYFLSALKKLDTSNYVAALWDFLNAPNADKLISNPLRGTGFYSSADNVYVRYIPRETEPGSDIYQIYEYYEADMLQSLLKTDFYKALQAGHIIRRCEFCGRYFLLKTGYHTKYCDQPNPDEPRFTCAQLGYHYNGIKEAVGDNPKAQSLRRCLARIEKDYSRGIISDEEKERLSDKARDMFHTAQTEAGISNEEFEESLQTKNLYPLCDVERLTNPRGRPAKSPK